MEALTNSMACNSARLAAALHQASFWAMALMHRSTPTGYQQAAALLTRSLAAGTTQIDNPAPALPNPSAAE